MIPERFEFDGYACHDERILGCFDGLRFGGNAGGSVCVDRWIGAFPANCFRDQAPWGIERFCRGGGSAVSDKVVSQVEALSGVMSVTRFAGATATDASIEVFKGSVEWGDTVILATSRSFQDALSIAPYSCVKHAPIFLSEASTGVLSGETLAAIRSGGFRRVCIVGGTSPSEPRFEANLVRFLREGSPVRRRMKPRSQSQSGA